MPLSWAPPVALLFAAAGSGLSIYSFIDPISAARHFDIDLTTQPPPIMYTNNEPSVQFVCMLGGRNLAIGIATAVFYVQRAYRPMSILVLCSTVRGIVDSVVIGKLFGLQKGLSHMVPKILMGAVGWALW